MNFGTFARKIVIVVSIVITVVTLIVIIRMTPRSPMHDYVRTLFTEIQAFVKDPTQLSTKNKFENFRLETESVIGRMNELLRGPNEFENYRRETEAALTSLNERLRVQRALLEEIACGQSGIVAWWDPALSKKLDILFAGQSVGDFGAGLGWYGRYLLRSVKPLFVYGKNVEETQFLNRTALMDYLAKSPQSTCQGYDGAGNVELVTGRFVRFLNLSEEQDLPVKFDWVMSLEIGEHILPAYEDIFLDNLVRHACKGIVLSWAVNGQGGHHHVNNHNNDVVKKLMLAKGFEADNDWELELRKGVDLTWLGNTILVFRRPVALKHPKCPSINQVTDP